MAVRKTGVVLLIGRVIDAPVETFVYVYEVESNLMPIPKHG